MFAEEIGGNATRRKQEEARARRRTLKQEQQKKANERQPQRQQQRQERIDPNSDSNTKSSVNINEDVNSIPIGNLSTVATATNSTSSTSTWTSTTSISSPDASKPSVIQFAEEQRQQRHLVQRQKNAAIKIQSFYRSHKAYVRLLNDESQLLTKRLQDLSTLRNLLKEKVGTDYVPPPATTTALVQQILFLCKSVPCRRRKDAKDDGIVKLRETARDSKLVHQILVLAVIPGIASADENVNPFAAWTQSLQGQRRIQSFLRLVLITATDSAVVKPISATCCQFLLAVMVPPEQAVSTLILETCRPLLLSPTPLMSLPETTPMTASNTTSPSTPSLASAEFFHNKSKVTKTKYYAQMDAPMDLISLLRHHLLYVTGGAPIPTTADKMREACIPESQRDHADLLFQAIITILLKSSTDHKISSNDREQYSLRLVSEILTVPLLTWKISDAAMNLLFSSIKTSKYLPERLVLVSLIETFTKVHKDVLNAGGDFESLLYKNDVALGSNCNATPIQCLLANVVVLGRSCVAINASQPSKLDYDASTLYFKFLATLVDAVPVSTFTTRESVVEWITDGKGHHSPVVIAPVVLEQCRSLVADAWVRKLFQAAMDVEKLQTDIVLHQKTDNDRKMELELLQVSGSSATTLASKEARIDRSKTFWNSSPWARKLTQGVATILNKGSNGGDNDKSKKSSLLKASTTHRGGLIDATAMSRKLAMGVHPDSTKLAASGASSTIVRSASYTPEFFKALCRVYGIVLARWGGGGGSDIVRGGSIRGNRQNGSSHEVATLLPDPCTQSLLSVLCFSTPFIRVSWGMFQSEGMHAFVESASVKSTCIRPHYGDINKGKESDGPAIFYLFIAALAFMLIITDDTEMHDMERPLPLHQLRRCVVVLKQILYKASCVDAGSWSEDDSKCAASDSNYFGLALINASSKTMWDLYDRSSRRPFCVPKLWIVDGLMDKELKRCKTEQDFVSLLRAPVLRVCPFLVSFKRRLRLFERIVYTHRVHVQGENNQNPFNPNPLKPGIPVRITRGRILEDGLATMNNLGTNMRQRIAILYYNEAGVKEAGIDAGGLFKEFWTDLSAIAFDPNYALFRVTDENCMYPNPSSAAAHGSDHIVLFEFLGRILGKALFEGITIHPQFAHFFLSFLRGDYNYLHMLPDLSTMDAQLYNNLMFLKTYDGNAEDLCLTFTVAVDDFGGTREIPLMPNGSDIEVNNSNKHRYIGKLLDFSTAVCTAEFGNSLSFDAGFVLARPGHKVLRG